MNMKLERLRSKYVMIFASVPLPERKMPIAVINDEPISWSLAYMEITQKTKTGDEILRQLDRMKII